MQSITVQYSIPGRIRLKIPTLRSNTSRAERCTQHCQNQDGILSAHSNIKAASLIVRYDPQVVQGPGHPGCPGPRAFDPPAGPSPEAKEPPDHTRDKKCGQSSCCALGAGSFSGPFPAHRDCLCSGGDDQTACGPELFQPLGAGCLPGRPAHAQAVMQRVVWQ